MSGNPHDGASTPQIESNSGSREASPAHSAENGMSKSHSIYTPKQKKMIVLVASMASLFSPMTASIYMPVLSTLAKDYNVSATLINLTVTAYLIFQGLAPTFVGGFSDDAGRRPAYMVSFIIYIVANTALALQSSYPALLILRMVQSAGSSGTIAIANGVVADVVTSAERGVYIGYASLSTVLGPALAPVIGGLLSQYCGWRWIFWFLLIFSAAFFIPMLLFFPETCRRIVGDGSLRPPLLNYSLPVWLKERRIKKENPDEADERRQSRPHAALKFPNPFRVLPLIFNKLSGIILVSSGILFCSFYAVSASISKEFGEIYHFNDLKTSLVFLPFGGGSLISAFTTGKLIDWNFRRHAKKLRLPFEEAKAQNLPDFPFERARLEVCLPLLYLSAAAIIGYGWSLEAETHLAIPLVILFIIGYSLVAGFNCMSILMVDIYPGKPALATAANNMIRCWLGAVATATLAPLSDAIGIGWTNTLFAALWIVSSPLLWWLMKKGPEWRREAREEKAKSKEERERKRKENDPESFQHDESYDESNTDAEGIGAENKN